MNLRIEIDLTEFKKGLSDLAKSKIPGAVASAMNTTAFGARDQEQRRMDVRFLGGATPYLKRSVRYEKASPDALAASVYISDESARTHTLSPSEILEPQIFGGTRGIKRSERRLRTWAGGNILRPGQYIVPGKGAPLDSRGNISGGQMQRILGYAKAFRESGYSVTKKTNHHFVVPGKGIFKRTGGSIVPVLIFTSHAPSYKPRLDFHETFRDHVSRVFFTHLAERWGSAMLKAGYHG